jgi:hypothetical protein
MSETQCAAVAATITDKTEVVTKRERSESNQFKVDAMKDFLDVVGEEDVDKFFLEMLETGKRLGYNLQAEPTVLLASIERRFPDVQAQA